MNSPSRDPGDLIPLTPLVFHVLLSLVAQQSHGYAIIQDVRVKLPHFCGQFTAFESSHI